MKRVLILFGVLDISVIILAYRQIFSLLTDRFMPDFVLMRLEYTHNATEDLNEILDIHPTG